MIPRVYGKHAGGFVAFEQALSKKQKDLVKKHGTPAQFAQAVYQAVPSDVSMDEARAAVEKYGKEWEAAA